MKELLTCEYGSCLYGTNIPESDLDLKVIYLPDIEELLLLKKPSIFKIKTNALGERISTDISAKPGDIETEYIPIQTFCRDFLNGQIYAVETANALANKPGAPEWIIQLVKQFSTGNVNSMASFAAKQVWDYIGRGERLKKARQVLDILEFWSTELDDLYKIDPSGYVKKRLDTILPNKTKLLHVVAGETSLEIGSIMNNNCTMETLKLNDREYPETMDLEQLTLVISKLVGEYGSRSNKTAEMAIDTKSLSHAVRIYEQAFELLTEGKISFPRHNASYLLNIKLGKVDINEVRVRLLALKEQVAEAQKNSALLPAKTPELEARFNIWLLTWLRKLYDLG